MAVYRYHVGITFTAVFIVLLIFKTLNIVNQYQRSHSNFQTKRSGYSATTFRGLFDENRKSALTVQQFNPDKYVQHKSTEFDYKTELNNLLKQTTRADDPRLIHILRNYIIEQPSTEPYSLTHPEKLEFSAAQTPLVDSVLKYMVSITSTSRNKQANQCSLHSKMRKKINKIHETKQNKKEQKFPNAHLI